jgi:hypothetical protein
LFHDELRTLAYGTDASFYRLTPRLVIAVQNESEVITVLTEARRFGLPLTFRAAGTSLSGQAISDSLLVVLGEEWNKWSLNADASEIRLQPGIVGAHANIFLAPHGKKIGPDPASINAAKIGGIAANNASGMCCGTAQNSYRTLAGMRIIFADGTLLDTSSAESRTACERPGGARESEPRACRQDPAQVQDEEHDRVQSERARGFRGSAGHHAAPHDRVRRDARVHRGGHLSDRAGTPAQGKCADALP